MDALIQRLFFEISKIPIIDPHSHIDPRKPTARDLDDLLGYHYYTELVHSSGLARSCLEADVPAEDRARAVAARLPAISNTVQYSWLLEIVRTFFGFPDDRIDATNVERLIERAESVLSRDEWEAELFARSGLERVFLTNDFDDPLEGFDRERYVPTLRADELVFRLGAPRVADRLRRASARDVGDARSLQGAIETLVSGFVARGARACAVSLPPDFEPEAVEAADADRAVRGVLASEPPSRDDAATASRFVFWCIASAARDHGLPFSLMIGVNRDVYPGGVHQGRDLFDRRVSLYPYRKLFNEFPSLPFPISVLAADGGHELAAYGWIFPNVYPSGHWWYSNLPAAIEQDLRLRLQGVPRTKLVGYYSDAYKLEFVLPKFDMYRRILARVLADDFVIARRWSEGSALALARDLLRGNVERIFLRGSPTAKEHEA